MNKKKIVNLKNLPRKKIAWGICGASHLLLESINTIKSLVQNGYYLDIFFSRAGKEVTIMFHQLSILENLHNTSKENINLIFSDNQGWSYPICGKFSQNAYDILIISPTTANTAAKIKYKIADTLITNIVSQSLKGKTPIIIIPTDYKVGKCKTVAIGNREIEIYIHKSDVKIARSLNKIKGITVISHPNLLIF